MKSNFEPHEIEKWKVQARGSAVLVASHHPDKDLFLALRELRSIIDDELQKHEAQMKEVL